MRLVTSDLDSIRMYFDDAIGSDDSPITLVAHLAAFFASLRLYNLKLSPNNTRIGAACVEFLGHIISQDGVRSNDDNIAALTRMPMPRDIKQLRSLLGGLSYYRNFLPNMAKRVRPITALLQEESRLVLLSQWKRPFAPYSWNSQLHRYLSSPIGTLLSINGIISPIVYISRATLTNKRNWPPMELEAGCVVWSIRRLHRYLSSAFFLIYTDHECLQ